MRITRPPSLQNSDRSPDGVFELIEGTVQHPSPPFRHRLSIHYRPREHPSSKPSVPPPFTIRRSRVNSVPGADLEEIEDFVLDQGTIVTYAVAAAQGFCPRRIRNGRGGRVGAGGGSGWGQISRNVHADIAAGNTKERPPTVNWRRYER